MILKEIVGPGFVWVDVSHPTTSDFENLAKKFSLTEASVQDCLEPEHLPKFESLDSSNFIILRALDPKGGENAATVQKLTRKLAIFFSKNFILTFHRSESELVQKLFDQYSDPKILQPNSTHQITAHLIYEVAKSYERSVEEEYRLFENFEAQVFQSRQTVRLQKSYLIKRRAYIMKRMLWLMRETVFSMEEKSSPQMVVQLKKTTEYMNKLIFELEDIHENLSHLLNFQVSLASQKTNEASHRTNEVVRVLTIVSVFLLPLNFIASIYGMNFEHMPGIKNKFGYPITLGVMLIVSILFLIWFKKKGWLKTNPKVNFVN